MTAYAISVIEKTDDNLIQAYRDLAAPSVSAYGGRYAARASQVESIEGSWRPNGVVILEFPSLDHAHAWYNSPEYADALAISRRALKRSIIFLEGI